MSRSGVEILRDDEEADIASFILNACGLELHDFNLNERILTRENLEKNYKALIKMLDGRNFRRAPYFVFGYFTLLTGLGISESLRRKILRVADWKHEEGHWHDKEFAIKRKAFLEDFREKVTIHQIGRESHTARFKYYGRDFMNSKVVVGMNQYKQALESGIINHVYHINLDGWDLKSIPQEIFNLSNLKSLSLEHNKISEIPREISDLTALKYLYLCYNQIKELPDSHINRFI